MSAQQPHQPGPKEAAKKELTSAAIWTALAAAFAVFMFYYAGKVDPQEKKNFYLLGGAIGAIIAAINGYNAWTLFQKSKEPPKAK